MATSTKESRRQLRQGEKVVRRAREKGQCVWNALLASVVGLESSGPTTHSSLFRVIRDRFAKRAASGRTTCVRWQGSPLTDQEMEECQEAVFKHINIGDGYLCSACDPLLVAAAVAFRINITHSYLDTVFTFEVDNPRRHVHLRSSMGHMAHVANQDLENRCEETPSRDRYADEVISSACDQQTLECNSNRQICNNPHQSKKGPRGGNETRNGFQNEGEVRHTDQQRCSDLSGRANHKQTSMSVGSQTKTQRRTRCLVACALEMDASATANGVEGLTKLERRAMKRDLRRSTRGPQ